MSQGQCGSDTCDTHAREVVHEQGDHVHEEDNGDGSGVEDHLHHRKTRVSKVKAYIYIYILHCIPHIYIYCIVYHVYMLHCIKDAVLLLQGPQLAKKS